MLNKYIDTDCTERGMPPLPCSRGNDLCYTKSQFSPPWCPSVSSALPHHKMICKDILVRERSYNKCDISYEQGPEAVIVNCRYLSP